MFGQGSPRIKAGSRRIGAFLIVLLLQTNGYADGLSLSQDVLLSVGEDKLVDLDFKAAKVEPKGLQPGNPEVVRPVLINYRDTPDKKKILFKPLKSGKSTVTVFDSEGSVRKIYDVIVTDSNLGRVTDELKLLMRDIEGIDFKILGDKIVIDGEVLVPSDYARLLGVLADEAYGGVVLNLVSVSKLALEVVSRRIQIDINTFAPNVKVRAVNQRIWLEGAADSRAQVARALKVAELYLPPVSPQGELERVDRNSQRLEGISLIQNFIVLNPPPPKKESKLVRITVHFVELSKDYLKSFGFSWKPGFTSDGPTLNLNTADAGNDAIGGASIAATISNLIPRLQSAVQAGYARVLESGTTVVRSGQPAKLSDEKDIPYAVTTQTQNGPQSSVQNAKSGLNVNVTPRILGQSEDIELDLKMSQKALAGSNGTLPIISDHRVETKLYIKSGESAAVSAVETLGVSTQFNKDDPLAGASTGGGGQSQPLFTLVRSKKYQKQKRHVVIFVTPVIIDNASDGTKDLKKNFRIKVQ